MMWDYVMKEVKVLLTTNTDLTPIFGTNFRRAGVGDLTVNLIEWTLLSDTESELWAPMLVQFDLWTKKAEDARTGERIIRALFQQSTSIIFDGYTMFSEYADGSDLAVPDRAGYTGRGIRFRFTPLRQRYATPV